jgi:hypothetical protein
MAMEKRVICIAFLVYFTAIQTNAEDTQNDFVEQRLALSEFEQCIYRLAYNSIAAERGAREVSGLIRQNCREQIGRVKAYTSLGNGFADTYIDMFLTDNYDKILREHKRTYRRR